MSLFSARKEDTIMEQDSTKRTPLPFKGFLLTLVIAVIAYVFMSFVPHVNPDFLPYSTVSAEAGHSLFYKLIWFVQDFTNAQFYASLFAGLGLVVGAFIAYTLNSRKKRSGGFVIAYTYKIFPWVFAAQILSLIISDLLYTPLLDSTNMGWIPTFIPFVSVPVIVILEYGPSLINVLTGAVLTGVLATPLGSVINKYVLSPAGLPVVAANVFTMSILGIIVLEACRVLPFIEKKTDFYSDNPGLWGKQYGEAGPAEDLQKPTWFVRRVLADFTEAQFYGNEWASGLMLLGVLIDWIINPASIYYGNNFLPIVICAQIVSSAVGVFLYYHEWEKGFYPTFLPVVTIVPGIAGICNGNIVITLLVAVLGGVIAPPLAAYITSKLPKGLHPMIGNTMSMAVCTTILGAVCKCLPFIGSGL